ncbi:hypothetical protein A8L34_05790 [Bacillus sp. FJAT-27264]|uniref:hypothetical protein n=1 Tax=Paenibacillus sp. (strain DSM 101736 / FJAT-27264) TaxID=1850362 RepID=UPI000807C931|nr:hypothetical protein [Bacillus sp. FJAT-27264]OBZ19049.1 hypothetical protein A8L34_05790 [Bacillus sp. FJAT-27264]
MSLFRKATFWFSLVSILVCVANYTGNDDKNILLIGFNPFLNAVVYEQSFRSWIIGTDDVIRPTAYLLHFASFFLTGAIVDILSYAFRRRDK